MNLKLLSLLLASSFLLKGENKKTIDFKYFTMVTPSHWQYIERRGFDSFVGDITLGNEKATFDYGYYSDNLDETINFRTQGDDILTPIVETLKSGRKVVKYVFYCKKDTFDKYSLAREQNYKYDVIDGHRAKIVTPKTTSGKGFYGVYFDSVVFDGNRNIELEIGANLNDPENYIEFIKAIYTLKFKKSRY